VIEEKPPTSEKNKYQQIYPLLTILYNKPLNPVKQTFTEQKMINY